jgi:rod shape-determining protein MreB
MNPTLTAPVSYKAKPIIARNEGEDKGATQKALLLGIDLGTSRSSIVSMHGQRKTVDSYVGWPKDAVGFKHLKSDVVFGRAALDNRLALNLYRPLEKGVIKGSGENNAADEKKNLEAAKLLLKHLVDSIEPGRDELLYGVVGVPSRATVKNKQAIIEVAREVLDSVMIVSEPFSVAYGLGRMSDVLVVDIGAGTTDLCRMHGTIPSDEDEISYTIAGDAIDQRLMELIQQRHPQAQVTQNMCKQIKEQYGFVSDANDKIEVMLPVNGRPTPHDLTNEIREACMILVPPILEGIQKLVSTFNPEFQEKLRHNIVLSGGGGLMDGLNKRVEDGMASIGGGRVTIVEEPLYAGANGALQLALDMPAEYWQQLR